MRLAVFNGSPRGQRSNTWVLLQHFLNGFAATEGNTWEMAYLVRLKEADAFVRLFREAEHVLLAFPLYTDAMPYPVKAFIESLEPLCASTANPDIGFIVHSGFPESVHSRYVERYLQKLARRLGCAYRGTVIKGGTEGIRGAPAWMSRGTFTALYEIGKAYGQTGEFHIGAMRRLAQPERMTRFGFMLYRLLGNMFWDRQLKKNNAFERRFARPYVDESAARRSG